MNMFTYWCTLIAGILIGSGFTIVIISLCMVSKKEPPLRYEKTYEIENGTLTINCNDKETFERFVKQYESISVC